jgi:hypothetical protein
MTARESARPPEDVVDGEPSENEPGEEECRGARPDAYS